MTDIPTDYIAVMRELRAIDVEIGRLSERRRGTLEKLRFLPIPEKLDAQTFKILVDVLFSEEISAKGTPKLGLGARSLVGNYSPADEEKGEMTSKRIFPNIPTEEEIAELEAEAGGEVSGNDHNGLDPSWLVSGSPENIGEDVEHHEQLPAIRDADQVGQVLVAQSE